MTSPVSLLLLIVCSVFLSPFTPRETSFTRLVQLIFCILLQHSTSKVQGTPDILSEASSFQQHKRLCAKGTILLVSYLNLSPVGWWKKSSSWWMLFCVDLISCVHLPVSQCPDFYFTFAVFFVWHSFVTCVTFSHRLNLNFIRIYGGYVLCLISLTLVFLAVQNLQSHHTTLLAFKLRLDCLYSVCAMYVLCMSSSLM